MGFVLTDAEQAFHYGDELSHFGVKGMKWGKRGAGASGGASGPSRGELKSLNKTARSENKAERRAISDKRDATIQDARANLGSKADALRAAKKQFKIEKKQIGSVAAKRTLNQAKDEFNASWEISQQPTRKEANRNAVIGAVAMAAQVSLSMLG